MIIITIYLSGFPMRLFFTLSLLLGLAAQLLAGRHHPYWFASAGFLLAALIMTEPRLRSGLILLPIGGMAGVVMLLLMHP